MAARRKRFKLPVFSRLTLAWFVFASACGGLLFYVVTSDDEEIRVALPISSVERFAPPIVNTPESLQGVRRAPPERLADRDAIAAGAGNAGVGNANGGREERKNQVDADQAGALPSLTEVNVASNTVDNTPSSNGPTIVLRDEDDRGDTDGTATIASVEPLTQPSSFTGSGSTGDPNGEIVITIDGRKATDPRVRDALPTPRGVDGKSGANRRKRPSIALALPDRALLTNGAFGPVPAVASDGRRASDLYARPFFAPFTGSAETPHIAMIVGGLGLNRRLTERAIDELPPEVTLAFAPYAKDLDVWAARAREAGHEIMLEAPMEHGSGDLSALGPAALLTSRSWRDNSQRLDWMMSRFEGYFGVTNYLGSKFSGDKKSLRPLLDRLKDAGLVYIDDTGEARRHGFDRSPFVSGVNTLIAPKASPDAATGALATIGAIEKELKSLESIAKRDGLALGKTYIYSATIDELVAWAWGVEERGFLLSPASAAVKEQAKNL